MLKWFLNHEDQFPLLGVFVGWIFQALVAQNVGAAVRVVYSVQAATFKVRESLALLATQLISLDAVVVYLRNLFVEQRTACSEASQLISSSVWEWSRNVCCKFISTNVTDFKPVSRSGWERCFQPGPDQRRA